jgi:hypothetical protein
LVQINGPPYAWFEERRPKRNSELTGTKAREGVIMTAASFSAV